VARRLPVAYAIYAVASVVLAASTFPRFEPLASFPRYLVVVFPCLIWLALWAGRHARGRVSLLMSAGLLAFFAAQFASWRWVA
jgi:amino acid permease